MDSGSTEDVDATGIITMVARDLCSVSVNLLGTEEPIFFGRRALYLWGTQCEGDMSNLLEKEMEVNVCCRFPESRQDKPSLVAVWIGDKPDIKTSDETLVTVYNQTGFVDQISDDGSFTIRPDSLPSTVIAHKEALYRDGCLAGVDGLLVTVDDRVMFDATPFEFVHASGARYRATCAWTGKEPRLVDRFALSAASGEQKLEVLTRNRVYGTVVVIPNEVIAFVEVEDAEERIWLFRDSFSQDFGRMHDVVKIGDRLCMRLCFAYIFGGCRQWFAIQAWKRGEEVYAENKDKAIPVLLHPSTSPSLPYEHADERNKVDFLEALRQRNIESGEVESVQNVRCDVMYSDSSLEGTFSSVSKKTALIQYKDAWITVQKSSLYINKTLVNLSEFRACLDKTGRLNVNFEAVGIPVRKVKNKEVTYETTLTWIGEKPSLFAVARPKCASSLLGKSSYCASKAATWYGRVHRFYLPDTAIILVDQTTYTVYAHVSSFIVADSEDPCDSFISDFVKVGYLLSFNVTHDPMFSHVLRAVNIRLMSVNYMRKPPSTRIFNCRYLREKLKKMPYYECKALNGVARNAESANASRTLFTCQPLQGRITSNKKAVKKGIGKISYEQLDVCVNMSVVYVGGQLCSIEQFNDLVKSRVDVNFEAVPRVETKCQMEFTHYATCVWIGEKPSLAVVASSLCNPECALFLNEDCAYIGKVKEFYLPDVALLMINFGTLKSVVCLHLREFRCELGEFAESENFISDFVKLGGLFELKIRKNDQCPLGLCVYDLGNSTKPTSDVFCAKDSSVFLKAISRVADFGTESRPCKASPFTPVYPLAKQSMVLNCAGSITVDPQTKNVIIKHMFGSSILDACMAVTSLTGDALVDENRLRGSNGCDVRFDAEFVATPAGGVKLRLKRVWLAESDDILASQIIVQQSGDLDPTKLHRGVITSTDLHIAAIAKVNGVSILVNLESIVASNNFGPRFSSVDAFFSVGDHVVLEVIKIRTEMGYFCKAKSCYKACYKSKKNRISPEGEPQVTRANEVSWCSVWGSGDFFRTASVLQRDSSYFVDFAPSQLPDTVVSLDVLEAARSGRLFEDGKPRKKSYQIAKSLKKLSNRKISFHAARHVSGKEVERPENLYVRWAWIGKYPDVPVLLQGRVGAFKGLLCTRWYYEGIVADFPLPTHAICNVGIVSVLLPLVQADRKESFIDTKISRLKIGDKVVLQIKEQFITKQTILVATLSTKTKKVFDDCEVLKIVRGKIIDLPSPKGKIKLDGAPIEVWFDRSSVLAINHIPRMNKSIFPWNTLFDKSVSVGTEVYFSAAKDLTLKHSYRAFEVWIASCPDGSFVRDPLL